jgi:dATP pyrophosphohydrolase
MANDAAPRSFKRPESVLVVVYTAAFECLLLERTVPRGFWQSVTGALRWDETPAQCAARELREETGLTPERLVDVHVERRFPILPAWQARYAPGTTTNREHRWYLELAERAPVRIDAREHAAYAWLPVTEAVARVASWTNREALEALLERAEG